MGTLLLEVNSGDSCDAVIPPLRRRLRGTLDFSNVREKEAKHLAFEIGTIPGQRIELNFDKGTCAILEPLHEPAHAELRAKLAKIGSGFRPMPAREEMAKFDAPSWYFWTRRMIDGGVLRVLSGSLPEKAPAGAPVKAIVFREHESRNDKRVDELSAAVASMARTVDALLKVQIASMPAAQRTAFLDQLGGK